MARPKQTAANKAVAWWREKVSLAALMLARTMPARRREVPSSCFKTKDSLRMSEEARMVNKARLLKMTVNLVACKRFKDLKTKMLPKP